MNNDYLKRNLVNDDHIIRNNEETIWLTLSPTRTSKENIIKGCFPPSSTAAVTSKTLQNEVSKAKDREHRIQIVKSN